MRILLAAPSFDLAFGGPTVKLNALRAALADQGAEVRAVAASRGDAPDGIPTRWRFHGTPIPPRLDRVVTAVRRSDVVHVIGYRDPIGTVAALAARRLRIPLLLEPAGMFRRQFRSLGLKRVFDQSIGRFVVGGARFVIATSQSEAGEIVEAGVPAARVVVRPNGVELAQFDRLPARGAFRRALGIPERTVVLLALGRITRKKGLPELIRAVDGIEDLVTVICGPDDGDGTLGRVRELAEGAPQRVRVLPGGLFGSERLQALADADLFCLYSMSENFGSAAAEAAAAGVATVVSDRCGVVEWMSDGVEVVTYGNAALLTARIRVLATDAAQRASLAARGRAAARRLGWPAVATAQMALYRRALGEQ